MIGKMTTARGESPAMSGSIRKARLYNRALSPVEVLSAYFEDTPTPATSEVQPKMADLRTKLEEAHKKLSAMAPPKGVKQLQDEARKSHEAKFGKKLKRFHIPKGLSQRSTLRRHCQKCDSPDHDLCPYSHPTNRQRYMAYRGFF